MTAIINEETGRLEVNGLPVYATMSGGYVDCMIRCNTENRFNNIATNVGLLVETEETDDQGVTTTVLRPAPGVSVSRIGSVVVTPAVLDAEGNEVTPAVMDDSFHVNFRLGPEAQLSGRWETWITDWLVNGVPSTKVNRLERALTRMNIDLIDPMSITTPANVFL